MNKTPRLANHDEIRASLGGRGLKRAVSKRTGGIANDKGIDNELQCGAYAVAVLASTWQQIGKGPPGVWICGQTGEFVDDLSFWSGQRRYHVQAKGGQYARWRDENGEPERDFRRQTALDDYRKIDSRSLLVVARANVRRMRRERPEGLGNVTVLGFDPIYDLGFLNYSQRKMIDRVLLLCPLADDLSSGFDALIVLKGVVSGIAGADPQELLAILQNADRIWKGVIAPPCSIVAVSSDVQDLLKRVPEFEFVVCGDTFHYRMEGQYGRSPFSWSELGEDFESVIRLNKPADVDELFPLVRGRW